MIMTIVGFDPGGVVTESSLTGMRLAYTFLPIAGVIGAILIMWNYDISEKRAAEIRRQLADKNGAPQS